MAPEAAPLPNDRVPPENPQAFEVNGKPLSCVVCGGEGFWSKRVLLNTRGLTFLDWDWLNRDALTVVCSACGFVHWFVTD